MKRNVVGAVLVAIAGLACSACGSGFLLNGIASGSSAEAVTVVTQHVVPLPPMHVVQRLPLSRTGTGSESLGTFAVHGNVRVRATCVGAGKIKVTVSSRHGGFGVGPVPCKGNGTVALDIGSNYATPHGAPSRIMVQAPPHMRWWLDVVDRQRNP